MKKTWYMINWVKNSSNGEGGDILAKSRYPGEKSTNQWCKAEKWGGETLTDDGTLYKVSSLPTTMRNTSAASEN